MGRKSKVDERKNEILDHYYQVVLEEGYENASIAKIAAHMNTQPSLILHYFKSKERMVFELITKFMHEFTTQRLEHLYMETNLRKRLELMLDFVSDRDKFPKEIYKMIYLVKYMSLSNTDINNELNATMSKYRRIIITLFQELYDAGIIGNPDVESLADIFIILLNGYDEMIHMQSEKCASRLYQDKIQELFKEELQLGCAHNTLTS